MRKLLPAFAVVLLTGLAAGVVGADCPPGQPCIMSGGDSENNSQGQEPVQVNGSDWSATLEVESQRPASNNTTEQLSNASYSTVNNSSKVTFNGVMQVPSTCYRPEMNVSKTGEQSYEAEIIKAQSESNDTMCTQVLTEISYRVNFTADQAFTLEATQGNTTETFQHPDYQEQDNSDQNPVEEPDNTQTETEEGNETRGESSSDNGSAFSGLFTWLDNLF